MSDNLSFIEKQFPVSKLSKESYKERKSSQGQTITGLGKWWGRKPLVLVRAAILGCLMPASDDPKKDMEIFLKIMSMDDSGLWLRRIKSYSVPALYAAVQADSQLKKHINTWFKDDGGIKIADCITKEEVEKRVFNQLGYDEKISLCMRPEQLLELESASWDEINHHLGTSASNLQELVQQLSLKRFGHNIIVGDCFSGGGSIPFEAARIGCETYASDLNPVAGLLTWADIHVCGADEEQRQEIQDFQQRVYDAVDKEVTELGIEVNDKGDRALSYLYCLEADCPECGWWIPLLPSLIVGLRAGKVVAELHENNHSFDITIKANASASEVNLARNSGTIANNQLVCPHCGKSTPISAIRHDRVDENGNTIYGLRLLEQNEFEFKSDDVFHERLYAIRYEHLEVKPDGKIKSTRYYCAPSERDIKNEKIIHDIVVNEFAFWQKQGLVPNIQIESGYNTNQIIRERGWQYWHQLFNPRQLFILSRFVKYIMEESSQLLKVIGILGLNKCVDCGSMLCRWHAGCDKAEQTFYNQALNTMMNWGTRGLVALGVPWLYTPNYYRINEISEISPIDARVVNHNCDFWITDPPYADAVNYHELSEYFLAWDKKLLEQTFPDWYTDSKRILAVRGDEHFSQTMIEIYTNLANHMPNDGMQVVMFTHSDPSVWAQLAIIMWKAGLKVTSAWNIATETESVGLKNGNYVKGTVLLVLRKRTGDDMAFLDEINLDIRNEVRSQIASMLDLDDKEDPNFSDPDYVLAAYAASLKVLTSYASIEDLDLDYELNQAISNPADSKIVTIIENAKKIAYDCVIPLEFESYLWKELSNAERFYIKGLESEKHGNYQISTYQEFARGFSIGGYSQMMANVRANTARLKTPVEMAGRTFNEVPDFENSLMRIIFMGIYTGVNEDHNPNKALGYIKNEMANYWDKRDMIKQILSFLIDAKDISNMQEHWSESAAMAELLLALVEHDSV